MSSKPLRIWEQLGNLVLPLLLRCHLISWYVIAAGIPVKPCLVPPLVSWLRPLSIYFGILNDNDDSWCRMVEGHGHRASICAVTCAGGFVFTGSSDCTVRVWTLCMRNLVATLRGHSATVLSILVSGMVLHILSCPAIFSRKVMSTDGIFLAFSCL